MEVTSMFSFLHDIFYFIKDKFSIRDGLNLSSADAFSLGESIIKLIDKEIDLFVTKTEMFLQTNDPFGEMSLVLYHTIKSLELIT